MWSSRLLTGALLTTCLLTGCNETPEYRISVEQIGSSDDTLYVNATQRIPKQVSGGSTELMFDLVPHRGGSFTFGLTFDLPTPTDEEKKLGRAGLVEMAIVSGGCVTRIITANLSNPNASSTALIPLSIKLNPQPGDAITYEEVPIIPPDPLPSPKFCYPMRRPLITSVQRQIVGRYGAPNSKMMVYGWGLLKDTKAVGALATPAPMPSDCTMTSTPCSAWDSVPLYVAGDDVSSTTRMPLDVSPLIDKIGPLLDQFGRGIPTKVMSSLSFVSGPKAKKMAPALFPFKVTVTTMVNGSENSDSFSEYP